MTKIIWMSDPHFQNAGTIDGLNPRTRLKAAITYLNTLHADADFAVMTGDLVGDDIEGDYSAIADYLAQSRVPLYPILGNNDERSGFRKHLTLPPDAMKTFVQYAVETPTQRFLFLDTHKQGSAAGQFCEERQAWLRAELENSSEKAAYIFMHHPPLSLGLPPQDEIKLDEADAFLGLISE